MIEGVADSERPLSYTNPMSVVLLAFLLGAVAGLRSMTAPAAAAWAAHLGWIHLDGTPVAFLGHTVAAYILAAAAVGELVADKLPRTPNRTDPGPFIARILTGGLSGAALVAGTGGSLVAGAIAGALGGAAGTLGGYRVRTGLVRTLGVPDYVVAIGEDLVAVAGAALVVTSG